LIEFQDIARGIAKPLHREIHIRAIMRLHQLETQYRRMHRTAGHSTFENISDGEEVPFALGHLLPFDEKKTDVEPAASKVFVPRGAAGLSDLALVMRKDQVLASRMNIDFLAELLHGHRRTLDVPAWVAGPPR